MQGLQPASGGDRALHAAGEPVSAGLLSALQHRLPHLLPAQVDPGSPAGMRKDRCNLGPLGDDGPSIIQAMSTQTVDVSVGSTYLRLAAVQSLKDTIT